MKEQTWKQWIRGVFREKKAYPEENHPSKLFNGCTAALTGTDYRVLDAFVPCMKLYVHTDDPALLHVARLLLKQMQPSTRWIARELIPFVRNWEDRETLWPLVEPTSPSGDFHPRGDFANHTGEEETGAPS